MTVVSESRAVSVATLVLETADVTIRTPSCTITALSTHMRLVTLSQSRKTALKGHDHRWPRRLYYSPDLAGVFERWA